MQQEQEEMISDELQLPLLCICVCKCFLEVNINFEAAQDKHCASGQTERNIPETTSADHFLKSDCAQCACVLAQITTRNGGGGSLRAHPAASARDTAGGREGNWLCCCYVCVQFLLGRSQVRSQPCRRTTVT